MTINTSSISDPKAQRRLFVLVQAAKASVGLALGLAFFTVAGRPDLVEMIALAGLAAPAVLALLGLTSMPLGPAGADRTGRFCGADRYTWRC